VAETFGAAPSGRRMLATDGCASSSSNPACCSCAVWALGGPRGVAVAMFGPTGLDMLICRIGVVWRPYIYALTCISLKTSVTLRGGSPDSGSLVAQSSRRTAAVKGRERGKTPQASAQTSDGLGHFLPYGEAELAASPRSAGSSSP
jgi:hypothetical protein